ncbi:MAG: metallophosphoesterase [Hyphomonadaceae bacterium]|nr:metallophosphoesterase [Hyphomonadaceae bacterium]
MTRSSRSIRAALVALAMMGAAHLAAAQSADAQLQQGVGSDVPAPAAPAPGGAPPEPPLPPGASVPLAAPSPPAAPPAAEPIPPAPPVVAPLVVAPPVAAPPAPVPPSVASPATASWDNVERVVTMGDLHGDYPKFVAMAQSAGLIDNRGDWIGGRTHFVQLGDIPDRGDETRKILDHLMRLEPQAKAAGGHIHALIGNHEAMNITGDLRYVSPGEYRAFVDLASARKRDAYFREVVRAIREGRGPGKSRVVDDAFRDEWERKHPLGFVEHRQAWATDGQYGRWIASHDAVIRINDTLYMHAGIGPAFPDAPREVINEAVRAALQSRPVPAFADILDHPEGPLWYRGFAINAETVESAHLASLLARHGVSRVVVGHTKRAAMVLPRFGGRVILTDIAVPAGYSDPHAFLVQENGALHAVHRGRRVPLDFSPTADPCGYFSAVAALDPPNAPTKRIVANCGAPGPANVAPASGTGQ